MSKQDKMDLWSSGDVGGFECYVEAEEETTAEASDVFKMDDDDGASTQQHHERRPSGGLVKLLSTLSLHVQDNGVMRFVKYLGGNAPSSRWDVAIDFKVADNGEE
eukprot:763250-Hanusia_phi.AAC.3